MDYTSAAYKRGLGLVRGLGLGAAMLTLAACATPNHVVETAPEPAPPAVDSGPRPAWVDGESVLYSRIEHFYRRGQAESPEAADAIARNKILKLLQISPAAAAETLPAPITILAQWHDNSDGSYYSLAAIPQQEAAVYLIDKVEQFDRQTQQAMQEARTALEPLDQLGAAYRAYDLQRQRVPYQDSLKVVNLTGRGIEPTWQLEKLQADLETLIANIRILPVGADEGKRGRMIRKILVAGLQTVGVSTAAPSDYRLEGRLSIVDKPQQNGWIEGQGQLKLDLVDKASQVLATKELQINTLGFNQDAAHSRILEKAEYKLKKEMKELIIGFTQQ